MKKDWLCPLSSITDLGSSLKNYFYDKKIISNIELTVPVISVGNLTFGGTGKTPIVDFLLSHFESRQKKVGVVSRSYKALVSASAKIDLSHPRAAAFYGDEAVLLAQKHPSSVFYVGKSKSETALKLNQNEKVDMVIVDDGFQHRRLGRRLDLVVVDATEGLETLKPFPSGRGREHYRHLSRADAILLSKSNLANDSSVYDFIKRQFNTHKIFELETHIVDVVPFANASEKFVAKNLEGIVIFSGLARPQQFTKTVSSFFDKNKIKEFIFPDHHVYTEGDVKKIISESKSNNISFLTTEKDAVKLVDIWPKNIPLFVVKIGIKLKGENESFFNFIDESIF